MKNLLLLLICVFSFCSYTSAQTAEEKSVAEKDLDQMMFGDPLNESSQNYFVRKKTRIEGGEENFYINKDWSNSTVFSKDGKETILFSANYLIEKRFILFKKEGALFQIYPHVVDMVILDGKIFKPYPSVDRDHEGILEFYEVPTAGYLNLVKVWDTKETAVTNNPMGIPDGNKVAISHTSKLYYKKGKQRKLKRLPKKKEDRYAIFGGKRRTVMAYAKEHKLSIKKEADLITLFTYYNAQESLEEDEN